MSGKCPLQTSGTWPVRSDVFQDAHCFGAEESTSIDHRVPLSMFSRRLLGRVITFQRLRPQPGINIMKRNTMSIAMKTSKFAASLMGTLCLGFAGSVLAATATETGTAPATSSNTSPAGTQQSAQKCMADLRVLDSQMQKEGTWLHGAGYGYGYPLYGYGYGYWYGDGAHGSLAGHHGSAANIYSRARPGYEIRTLIASATILAQRGQQPECDALLTTAREIYKGYAGDLQGGKLPTGDGHAWRRKQIAAALPVAGSKAGYRSDQLIGADVVNAQGDDLGDVYDVVMNSQTGKIDYLVVGRGGVFGIGERHVPVPWGAFKITAGSNMMVLDTTKSNLDAAPRVAENHFSPSGEVGQQGKSADAFWKTRILK